MRTTRLEEAPSWLKDDPLGLSPDACLTARESDGAIAARCALWWSLSPADPEDPTRRLGCIGQFDCSNPAAGGTLLEEACRELREQGCRRAVGPMDGDTWHSYRLVTGGWDAAPRFALEPWNSARPVEAFALGGFLPLECYSSSEALLEECSPDDMKDRDRLALRLAGRGIEVRSLRRDRFADELDRLHALSEEAFRDNFLYTPITRQAFRALYAPVEPLVAPEFVLLAERGGELAGYVFALPDLLAPESKRLVVKTLAVGPGSRHLGLGAFLVGQVQDTARKLGYRAAIHALQHEGNVSRKITRRHAGRIIREYTLFQRCLLSP